MSVPTPLSPEPLEIPAPGATKSHSAAVPAALLGFLAALLSLIGSTAASLWTDEAATISAAQRSWRELWELLNNVDAVHGLYYAFMHVWGGAFGFSPLALRLPSALAVGVAASGLYVLSRRLGGPRLGLAAALIFAILPRTTWMGMEGRSFALSAAAVTWLSVLLAAAVEARGRRQHLLFGAYALLAALGTYVNIYVALAVAAHGLALVLLPRLPRPALFGWAAASLAAAVLASPVVVLAAGQTGQLGSADLSPGVLLRNVAVDQWFLGDTPTNPYLDSSGLQLWQPASVLLALTGWMLVCTALLSSLLSGRAARILPAGGPGSRTGRRLFLAAAPMLMFPPAVLIAFSLLASPLYNARYLSFATPAAALLLALGIIRLQRVRMRVTAGVLLVVLALPVYVSQRQSEGKSGSDWEQVAAYVDEQADEGDAVYFGPRHPPEGNDVGQTQRRIATAYPNAFATLKDVSLKYPGSSDGSLDGRSLLIQDCGPELATVDGIWLVRRRDYPRALLDAEDKWLKSEGFLPDAEWTGNTNTVTGFSRNQSG